MALADAINHVGADGVTHVYYFHVSGLKKNRGDYVHQNEVIALSGGAQWLGVDGVPSARSNHYTKTVRGVTTHHGRFPTGTAAQKADGEPGNCRLCVSNGVHASSPGNETSGNSTGPHLHIQYQQGPRSSDSIDPCPFFDYPTLSDSKACS